MKKKAFEAGGIEAWKADRAGMGVFGSSPLPPDAGRVLRGLGQSNRDAPRKRPGPPEKPKRAEDEVELHVDAPTPAPDCSSRAAATEPPNHIDVQG